MLQQGGGERRATWWRTVIASLLFLYTILVLWTMALAPAVRFTDGQFWTTAVYWGFAVQAMAVPALAFCSMVVYSSKIDATLVAMIMLFVALLARLFSLGVLLWELAGCDTSTQCAGNALCDGTFLGPYPGVSTLYWTVLAVAGLSLLCEVLLAMFVNTERRRRIMCQRAFGGAGVPPPPPPPPLPSPAPIL